MEDTSSAYIYEHCYDNDDKIYIWLNFDSVVVS